MSYTCTFHQLDIIVIDSPNYLSMPVARQRQIFQTTFGTDIFINNKIGISIFNNLYPYTFALNTSISILRLYLNMNGVTLLSYTRLRALRISLIQFAKYRGKQNSLTMQSKNVRKSSERRVSQAFTLLSPRS